MKGVRTVLVERPAAHAAVRPRPIQLEVRVSALNWAREEARQQGQALVKRGESLERTAEILISSPENLRLRQC